MRHMRSVILTHIICEINLKNVICLVSDDDYEAQTDFLTFPPGTTSVSVPLENIDNGINEELEFFSAVLSTPTNGLLLGTNINANVFIVDDDGK